MRPWAAITAVLTTGTLTLLPLASAAAAPTSPTSGPGTIGIRLVPVPGVTSNALASSYIVAHLAPGATLTRVVQIENNTNHFADLAVYVAAASVRRGSFVVAPGAAANDLSSWTSVTAGLVGLEPHSEVFDTVTTNVPSNASAGDRQAVVWVAMTASPVNGQGITLVSRAGVRMYISIGPGGAAPSNFVLGALSAQRSASGRSVVTARVHNSGGDTLDLTGALTFSKGPGGINAGPFVAQLGVLLSPGASESVTVTLGSRFPRGPWRAELRVRSGSLARSTVATITFPARHLAPEASSDQIPLVPLLVTLFAVLFLLSFLAFLHSRRSGLLTRVTGQS
jgi:hypothetical protein